MQAPEKELVGAKPQVQMPSGQNWKKALLNDQLLNSVLDISVND